MCATNYSDSSNFRDRTHQAIGVISFVYAPVITIVNILLVVSFVATKQTLKQSSNFLIVCISISDALVGAILMPLVGFINVWHNTPKSCWLNFIAWIGHRYFSGASLQMTTLLALDRYLHMNPDFHAPPSKLSKLFIRPNIFGTVFLVHIITGGLMLGMVISARIPNGHAYVNIVTVALIFFFSAIFVAMYTRGYLRVRRSVTDNILYQGREDSGLNERPEYLKKLFKTVLILLISMFVAWIPINLLPILALIHVFGTDVDQNVGFFISEIAFLFFDLNTAINALIIFYRNKRSREWLVRGFRRCCRLKNEEEEA